MAIRIQNILPHKWGYFVTIFLVIGLHLPKLTNEGLFMDGYFHASLARNLAVGKGSFWAPQYGSTMWSPYTSDAQTAVFGTAPLLIGIEAIAFYLLGDHWWVEKCVCFLLLILTLAAVSLLWRTVFDRQSPFHSYDWVAWIAVELMYNFRWVFYNNMLEMCVILFSTLAISTAILSVSRPDKRLFYSIITGILLMMSLLAKGPVGLFPLATPVLFSIIFSPKSIVDSIKNTLGILLTMVSLIVLLAMFPAPKHFFIQFWNQQLYATFIGRHISHEAQHHWSFFAGNLLHPALLGLLGALGLLGIQWLNMARISVKQPLRVAIFFSATGLTASLPIMLIARQNMHYFAPSIVYFALASAVLLAISWSELRPMTSLSARRVVGFGLLCVIAMSTAYSWQQRRFGNTDEVTKLLEDLKVIHAVIPTRSYVHVSPTLLNNPNVSTMFQRYYQYYHTANWEEYALTQPNDSIHNFQLKRHHYRLVSSPLVNFYILKKQP
jgi:4-amino-4-deoxy-L-arabinose transferase-like glycosyltransferase